MRPKSEPVKMPAEQVVKDIRRATWQRFSAAAIGAAGLPAGETPPDTV